MDEQGGLEKSINYILVPKINSSLKSHLSPNLISEGQRKKRLTFQFTDEFLTWKYINPASIYFTSSNVWSFKMKL